MSRRDPDLDQVIDAIVESCACDACARYRAAFARRVAYWAARLELVMGRGGPA